MHIRKKFAVIAIGLSLLLTLASINVVGTQASVKTTSNEQLIKFVKSTGVEFPIPKNENHPSCLFYLKPTKSNPNDELTKTFYLKNIGSTTETVYVRKNIHEFTVTYLQGSTEEDLKTYKDYPENTQLEESVTHKKVVIAPGERKEIRVTFYLTYERSEEGNHHFKHLFYAKWGERNTNQFSFEHQYGLILHGTNDYSSSKPSFLANTLMLRFLERIPALANLLSLLR